MTCRLAALSVVLLVAPAAAKPSIQNNEWNVQIATFGAAAASGHVKARLRVGQKLQRFYVRCEREGDTGKPTCTAADRKTLRSSGEDPIMGGFWTWAEKSFSIADPPASPTVARAVAAELAGDKPVDGGANAIVILDQTIWTLEDEYRGEGCENAHGHPCDPIAVKTGKKVREPHRSTGAFYGGYGLPVDSMLSDELLEMLGSGRATISPELMLPFGTPHQDVVLAAYNNQYRAAEALPYLETVQESDPDMRLALAYDRVVIAAVVHDGKAFAAAYQAFDAERKAHGKPPRVMETAFARVVPTLDLIAKGKVALSAPFGLDAYVPK